MDVPEIPYNNCLQRRLENSYRPQMHDNRVIASNRQLLQMLLPLVTGYVVYAMALIFGSSFEAGGQQWFSLYDDAMISMRYSRNLTMEHALVWNPGERVEGFTNLGWTLVMALVHLIEPRQHLTSLYMQVISMLCLVCTLLLTGFLAVSVGTRSVIAAVMATLIVAFYFPLNFFSLMGMETGVLALLITGALFLVIRAGEKEIVSRTAWVLLFAAVLVRLDAVVPLLFIAFAVAFVYPGIKWSTITYAVIVLVTAVGGQTLARFWYYGEWLPNTYYLKMGEVPLLTRLGRGLFVTGRFLYNHLLPFYLLIPWWMFCYFRDRDRIRLRVYRFFKSPLAILLAVVVGQLCYSIYVGGDVWEREFYANRFLVIVIPIFYILFSQTLVYALEHLVPLKRLMCRFPLTSSIALGGLIVVQSNWHIGYETVRDQALLRVPLQHTEDARAFARLAHVFSRTLPPDTTLAIDRAGTLPYFMPDYQFYDVLGKSDPVIARQRSRSIKDGTIFSATNFIPGHTKWDAAHTLGKLKPDILILTISIMDEDYNPYLTRNYRQINIPDFFGTTYVRAELYDQLAPLILKTAARNSLI